MKRNYPINTTRDFTKTILIFVIILLSTFNSFAQKDENITQISNYLEKLSEDEFFGLSIAISKKDQIIFQKGYGYANREHQVPNQPSTKINIASIGKMFTAVAILQLKEQGKLELNQPIGKYLPDFPNPKIRESVTIHQALTHTSGLPLWFNQTFANNPKFSYLELEDYLPLFKKIEIDSSKIGNSSYSNVGFCILGYIIEAVAEMPYKKYVQKHIFKPSGMTETGLWNLTEIIPNAAVGYIRPISKDGYWTTNFNKNMSCNPAGGAFASVLDLTKFYQALRNHQLLSASTTALMFEPKTLTPSGDYGYGYGIGRFVRNDKIVLGHLGGFFGTRGELMWFQEANYTIAILANSDQTDYIDVSYFIETLLIGTEEEKNIYHKTHTFIDSINQKDFQVNSETIKKFNPKQLNETLIQIKGYHFYNNQKYKAAEKLFKASALLYPESEGAKNDLKKVTEQIER